MTHHPRAGDDPASSYRPAENEIHVRYRQRSHRSLRRRHVGRGRSTDAGRTAGVNANVVLAIVAVAQFMVVLDASIVQRCAPDDQAGPLARVVTFSRRMCTRLARS